MSSRKQASCWRSARPGPHSWAQRKQMLSWFTSRLPTHIHSANADGASMMCPAPCWLPACSGEREQHSPRFQQARSLARKTEEREASRSIHITLSVAETWLDRNKHDGEIENNQTGEQQAFHGGESKPLCECSCRKKDGKTTVEKRERFFPELERARAPAGGRGCWHVGQAERSPVGWGAVGEARVGRKTWARSRGPLLAR